MPQRRMHFGRGLIQKHCWCNSRLWPYAWSLSSIAFDVKGRKKESLSPRAKNNFWGLEAKQRWCQLSPRTADKPAVSWKPISSHFSPIFLPPLPTLFPPGHAGETSQIKLGKLWVSISYSPAEVVASPLQSLLTESVELIRRLAPSCSASRCPV